MHKDKLTGCCEDTHYEADLPVPQQGHVCMVCLSPVFIPFGFNGGPDADSEHQQVEYDGGYQSRDVESHADGPGAAQTHRVQTGCMQTCAQPK